MIFEHDRRHRPLHDPVRLRSAVVRHGSRWVDVEVVGSTGSTNADLAAAGRQGAESRVLLAEEQTQGRGRLDRSWQVPAGAGITMSMLAHTPLPLASWTWLPLLTGLAACEAVRRVAGVEASVKWPNDVLVGERKLAGVLTERVETPHGPAAVIGLGLNVAMTPDELPVPNATSVLIEAGEIAPTTPDELVAAVATGVDARLRQLEEVGGDAGQGLRAAYAGCCATIGQDVDVHQPGGGHLLGRATGVDRHGRLEVHMRTGLQAVAAGDVVHVRPAAEDPASS